MSASGRERVVSQNQKSERIVTSDLEQTKKANVAAQGAPKKGKSFSAAPNTQLNAHLQGSFPRPPNLTVSTFHHWMHHHFAGQNHFKRQSSFLINMIYSKNKAQLLFNIQLDTYE